MAPFQSQLCGQFHGTLSEPFSCSTLAVPTCPFFQNFRVLWHSNLSVMLSRSSVCEAVSLQSFRVGQNLFTQIAIFQNLRANCHFQEVCLFCAYFYAFCICSFHTYWHWVHRSVWVLYVNKMCSSCMALFQSHINLGVCWHSSRAISI